MSSHGWRRMSEVAKVAPHSLTQNSGFPAAAHNAAAAAGSRLNDVSRAAAAVLRYVQLLSSVDSGTSCTDRSARFLPSCVGECVVAAQWHHKSSSLCRRTGYDRGRGKGELSAFHWSLEVPGSGSTNRELPLARRTAVSSHPAV